MKDLKVDEKAMTRTEAIILSMTPKERDNPSIINASRKQRIAQGAGVRPQDVNSLQSPRNYAEAGAPVLRLRRREKNEAHGPHEGHARGHPRPVIVRNRPFGLYDIYYYDIWR